MASHGYLPAIKRYLGKIIEADCFPSVLEIGTDRGCMLLPIVSYLIQHAKDYLVIGVDVLVQESLAITLANMDHNDNAILIQENSLTFLPQVIERKINFDVVLIDGDHNYYTVKQELQYLDKILKPSGVAIIDDYSGRWAERDLWYSEREGYEKVEHVTKRVDVEKQGVKPAVDEFLAEHPDWHHIRPLEGEPILLMRKEK